MKKERRFWRHFSPVSPFSFPALGLFGLATYMAETRIKEIGVRKVLGASVTGITFLISRDFFRLVVIAFLIAAPIAWWSMETWLKNYSYRVNIHWWVFALAGGVSFFIALVTISYQAIRAAVSNPVNSLQVGIIVSKNL